MFAKQITVQKVDANWEELLSLAHEGTEITIMEGDETIAKIVSAHVVSSPSRTERILGAHPGVWMSEEL